MSEHRNPRLPFYMAVIVGNSDGTMDLESETNPAFDSEIDAVEYLSSAYRGHGCQGYVYHCVPLVAVLKGEPEIKRLKASRP